MRHRPDTSEPSVARPGRRAAGWGERSRSTAPAAGHSGRRADLDLTTGMTLSAWVYPTALSGWRTVVMKEAPGSLAYVLYAHDQSPRPAAYITNTAGVERIATGTGALSLNTWTHLATTYDGATLRLFVNGLQVRSVSATGVLRATTGELTIGGNDVWGELFAGRIDEVRIYNRAQTAGVIQVDMGCLWRVDSDRWGATDRAATLWSSFLIVLATATQVALPLTSLLSSANEPRPKNGNANR